MTRPDVRAAFAALQDHRRDIEKRRTIDLFAADSDRFARFSLRLDDFLFDFSKNIYGDTIDIDFIAFLREDAKFRSMEALVEQIAKDCEAARLAVEAADRDDPMAAYPLGCIA